MPFDGITEIAKFSALQTAGGFIITPQGRPPVLSSFPTKLVGTAKGEALLKFTADCFGITDGKRIVSESYIKDWAQALFVPEDAAAVEAEVTRIIANTPGIRQKNQKLTDQLAQAAKQMTDWKCETVEQMGEVAAVAERMARTFGKATIIDDMARATWVKNIGEIAQKNGDSADAIYATAGRIDQLLDRDKQLVDDVYRGTTNLSVAEQPVTPSGKAMAEIARYAVQASSGFILPPLLGPAVLGPLPTELVGTETAAALMRFTDKCFGIDDPQKIIGPSYIERWANALDVAEGADADDVLAEIEMVLKNTPGIDASKELKDQLAQAQQQMRDWKCASLDQTGEVASVAERMARAIDGVKGVDEKSLNAAVAKIATFAVLNGGNLNDIFSTAKRIDRAWANDETLVEELDKGTTTLAKAEESLWPDQVHTEIAQCAWQISQNEDPNIDGKNVLVDSRPFSAGVYKMVREFGKELFGSETFNGKVVDPAVIRDWADRCPKDEIGSTTDIADRGDALTQYIAKRTQQIHANHVTGTNSRLPVQYQTMRDRKCDTTVEASTVYDYAIQMANRDAKKSQKVFQNEDEKAEYGLKQIATTMEHNNLKGTSQFDFMTRMIQLEKTDQKAADRVWERKDTIAEAEEGIGSSGKEKEKDPEKDPHKGGPEIKHAVAM